MSCSIQGQGNLSPQFHLVHDDYFETVHSDPNEEPSVCPELLTYQRTHLDIDEDVVAPELSDEWLSDAERQQRQRAELEHRGAHMPTVTPSSNPPSVTPSTLPTPSVTPSTLPNLGEPVGVHDGDPPSFTPSRSPSPKSPQGVIQAHRECFKRTSKPPDHFTFDQRCGYKPDQIVKGLLTQRQCSTHAYEYAMLFSQDGTIEEIMPQAFEHGLFKANKNDPDSPNFAQAMSGTHAREFKQAMGEEIKELEEHGTWEEVAESSLPPHTNVLPGTWAFKVK